MPFLEASDGIRLHCELEGGPPLLAHLGAGCDVELWRAGRPPRRSLVSQTVRDLVAGSGLDDRGAARLSGIPGEWRLYVVTC